MRNLLLVITLIMTLVGQGFVANHSFAMSMPQMPAATANVDMARTAAPAATMKMMDCCQGMAGCECQMSAKHCATASSCVAHCSLVSAIADVTFLSPATTQTQRISVPLWSVQTAISHVQTPPPNLA